MNLNLKDALVSRKKKINLFKTASGVVNVAGSHMADDVARVTGPVASKHARCM